MPGTQKPSPADPSPGEADASPEPGPAWWTLHLWQIQGVRDVLVIAGVIALVWLGYAMRSVTTPLLVALGLAYLFEPVIGWITRRWGISRAVTVSSLLLMLVGGVLITLVLTAPLAIRQATSLARDLSSGQFVRSLEPSAREIKRNLPAGMQEPFRQFLEGVGITLPTNGDVAAESQVEIGEEDQPATSEREESKPRLAVATTPEDAEPDEDARIRRIVRDELAATSQLGPELHPAGARMTSAAVVAALRRGWDTAAAVLGLLLQVGLLSFLIPFYFFFFSVSYPAVQSFAASLIPHRGRERTLELLRQMDAAVAGFVRGRVVISAIVGFICAVGWLAVGVPYSIVLGIVVGVFNLVPYLSSVGLPLAVGLMVFAKLGGGPAAEEVGWLWVLGAPTAVFVLAQVLDGYVLTPLIAGKATNLDPVTIFVAVLAGGSIAGVYGMLLAIPAAACLKILLRSVFLPRVKQWVEGRVSDPLPM